jgi:ribosomal protein S18 acetylase RimI-like enzyme
MAPFDVSPAAPHEFFAACRLLFPEAAAELCRTRLLAEMDTTALLVARGADGRVRSAALVQVLPGAAGVVVPPGGESAAREAVIAPACAWLRARGVRVGQAFATAGDRESGRPLEPHGFRHVTQLVFLRRPTGVPAAALDSQLRWTAWSDRPTPDQLDLLLATHAGTLDCPELNAPRTAAEVVAGFQPNNAVDRMWWSCRDATGTPVGVLLVLGGEGSELEISYLGLIPSARGRGLAGAVMRFAERVAAGAAYPSMIVSVDARNAPALKLYVRHGFVEYDRREVWLAAWPG